MPLVSIITPSYNQAAFLEQTIQSVLRQDYAQVEYVVIDGASTDGSLDIIQRYTDRLDGWISEPDSGQAEAINKGLRDSRGEIVAWLNSDDLYLPGAVTSAVAVLEADPSLGMVFGDAITVDADGRPLNQLAFGDWQLVDLMGFRIICQPAVFMRRAVLEKAGFLDPSYHFMLDHHLWLRMARLAPIRHIPVHLAAARYHQDAKNVKQALGFSLETQRILEWMQTQPDLARIARIEGNKIKGGAYRLQARYFLDGDQPAKALQFYARALLASPRYALKHWRRMLYAAAALLGFRRLADHLYYHWDSRRADQNEMINITGLEGWPGLLLEDRS